MAITWLRTFCLICGLAASIWAIRAVMVNSPAFTVENRVDGLFGQWRTRTNPALYDRATYLFQKGYEYLNADVIASAAGENADRTADNATGQARAEAATQLLTEAVRLDPANAHAWAALAWARTGASRISDAREAMAMSWNLAPHHFDLAIDRLAFMEMLAGPLLELLETPISPAELDHQRRDMAVVARFSPQ